MVCLYLLNVFNKFDHSFQRQFPNFITARKEGNVLPFSLMDMVVKGINAGENTTILTNGW